MKNIAEPEFQRGFTLLELAIVISIIALITGSIFVGTSMIRTAQINSIITEVARYNQAFIDFRDKYQAYPGDFTNAEALWGSDVGCPNSPTNMTPHKATCNGDGDGLIGMASGTGNFNVHEWFRAWQHLVDAGMMEGSFSGMACDGVYCTVLGVNAPASQLRGAGYTVTYFNYPADVAGAWWPLLGHALFFGQVVPNSTTYQPALTPQEAWGIDTKLDDGLPGSGKVMTGRQAFAMFSHCTTTDNPATAQYNAAYTDIACMLIFQLGF